jgi:hypothetical protein
MSAWKLGDNCDDDDEGDDNDDDEDDDANNNNNNNNNSVKRHNRVCARRPFNICKESGD